ncbi:MAG TPA: AMP-binding protein, partial [Usitatibacteraceae bacterium]|nr:AMP-binding protein [Usitatibacteraceae bacterium]
MTEKPRAEPPWLKFYGSVPPTLDYPDISLYEGVARVAARSPHAVAWEYFGTRATYRQLVGDIDRCAALLTSLGLKTGERMLISMPTTPQGVIAFYAVNRIGAVAVMIHPLSTAAEITHYLDATGARMALVLDAFYATLAAATPSQALKAIVVASVTDPLPALKRAAFWLSKGHAIAPLPRDTRIHRWSEAMHAAPARWMSRRSADDEAVILFSGGTTALPKGIRLSNRAFVAQAIQAAAWCRLCEGNSMLAILPLFHGFGLAVCVNAVLMAGGTSILVPQFSAPIVAGLLKKRGANVLVGVPTLFDALTREPLLQRTDLSCLKLCFCGADTLPRVVKERFEALVKARGGDVKLLEGYGLTEAVSGIMAMPLDHYREGSIGVPFPDMFAKICAPDTTDEVPVGTEGEICLAGPAQMMG